MKILHLLNHVCNSGNGIVNVGIDLACLQSKAGHSVVVASAGGEYESLLSQYGVDHIVLDQARHPLTLVQATWKYRELIKRLNPDVVHTHMITGVVLAYFLRFNARYKLFATLHNEFQQTAVLMGLANRVIAVSDAVAQSMVKRGISAERINVIRNGTLGSPRSRSLTEYQPYALQRPSISTVAGMNRRKGIIELIEAFDQISDEFPEAHLYLVGDGPEREEFEHFARAKASCSRIHFEGFQSEPQRYLLSTDIFVLASHKDPCPLVIPEAREAGCAIVASAVDGIPESLDHGKAGILVPPGSVEHLSASLKELLSDEALLESRKREASLNLSYLTTERVYRETISLYEESCQNFSFGTI